MPNGKIKVLERGTNVLTELTATWEKVRMNRNVDGELEYRVSPGTRWCAAGARIAVGEGARLGAWSRLHDLVLIGANVEIGMRCVIEAGVSIGHDSGIGDDTVIRRAARIGSNTVLWGSNIVGETARVGSQCHIGNNTQIDGDVWDAVDIARLCAIGSGAAVLSGTRIGAECEVAQQSRIYPNCVIGHGVRIGSGCQILEGATLHDDVTLGKVVIVAEGEVLEANSVVEPFTQVGTSFVNDPIARRKKLKDALRAEFDESATCAGGTDEEFEEWVVAASRTDENTMRAEAIEYVALCKPNAQPSPGQEDEEEDSTAEAPSA